MSRFKQLFPFVFALSSILPFSVMGQTGQLPADAQRVLDQLPGGEITMDVVLALGLERSSEFKAILAQAPRGEAAILASQAPLDTQLIGSVRRGVDKTDQINAFTPDESSDTTFQIGASKYLSSGTTVNGSYGTGHTSITFPPVSGPFQIEDQAQHRHNVSLEVRQRLFQDAFGRATRSALREAEATKESITSGVKAQAENWALGLIGFYYQVWLAKSEYEAATESLSRQERLSQITQVRLRRGTAERPDSLQMQAQLNSAKLRQANASEALRNAWRQLVIKLGLPQQWVNIDPALIPVRLDDPIENALATCGPAEQLNTPPQMTALIKQREKEMDAANERVFQATDRMRPNLEAFAGTTANAYNPESSTALRDTLGFENPSWQVGLSLTLPLGNSGAKAGMANAIADQMNAEANKFTALEQVETQWLNECKGLHQLGSNIKVQEDVYKAQQERERLEEGRFQIGRTQAFNVLQAGTDAIQADVILRQTKVQARLAAWRILQIADQLQAYLDELQKMKVSLN